MATNIHTHPGMAAREWDEKVHHVHSGMTRAVSWIALLASLFSVILSVSAYNRTGRDLQAVVADQVTQTKQEASLMAARAESRTRLMSLRAQIAAGQATDETLREIQEIRRDLAAAYQNTTGEVRQDWMRIDDQLGQLENQARNNSAEAVGTLQKALEDLRIKGQTSDNRR